MSLEHRSRRMGAFFNPRHFGQPATLIRADGVALDLTVIVDLEYLELDLGAAGVDARRHRATCATVDVPGVAQDDVLRTVAPDTGTQTTWRIADVAPDADGVTVLELQETA